MASGNDGYLSGAHLLASDATLATLLLREARNRACERYLGVEPDDSALVTLIALAAFASLARAKLRDAWRAPGGPTRRDGLIGAGLLGETIHLVAGDWSREVPGVAILIVAAVIAHGLRPWARVSLHDARAMSHRARVDFDHRYGHLIRPDRKRPPTSAPAGTAPSLA